MSTSRQRLTEAIDEFELARQADVAIMHEDIHLTTGCLPECRACRYEKAVAGLLAAAKILACRACDGAGCDGCEPVEART